MDDEMLAFNLYDVIKPFPYNIFMLIYIQTKRNPIGIQVSCQMEKL